MRTREEIVYQTAIVILNWNGIHFLQQFLQGVVASVSSELSDGVKVIVADNCSTDGSVNWIRTHCPEVLVLELDQNYGFTGGYNRALAQISAQYYLLLNSDVEVTPNFLSPLVQYLECNPSVAACSPKLLAYHNRHLFEHAGAAGGYIDVLAYPFCRGRIMDYTETDEGQYNDNQLVFWASGAALMIRAELFWKAGGLNELFFAHMEEIDLCWRLQRMGYQIACVPSAVVYHVGGGALPKTSARKTYLNFRNNLSMLTLNLPLSQLCWVLPSRLLLDALAGFMFILQGQFSFCWAIVQAHWSFFFKIPTWIKLRKAFCPLSVSKQLHGVYKGSIVFQYYKSKKKLVFTSLRN